MKHGISTTAGYIRYLEGQISELKAENKRYERLRVLGCAPYDSQQLTNSTVLRFQSLDQYIDNDIKQCASRGEYKTK